MAKILIKRTINGWTEADEESKDAARKFKVGTTYRATIVKPRSYKFLKLTMALLTMTWENLPHRLEGQWRTFDQFRYAVAEESGHVIEYTSLDGEVKTMPGSISYDAIPDDVTFGKVMAGMMTVCARILDIEQNELAAELSKYADERYGAAA